MSDYFPQEILKEIFHRLPLKSIVKCTCVCKAWKSIITHNTFINDHLNLTIQANHGNDNADASLFLHLYRPKMQQDYASASHDDYEESYLIYSDYYYNNQQIDNLKLLKSPFSRPFLHKYSRVVGTCNGLVCVADYSVLDSATVIIWNPCIRKYVVLPKPKVTFKDDGYNIQKRYQILFGFGYDSRNKDFKVIRLVNLEDIQDNPPQVEAYSLVSHSWRKITARAPPFLACDDYKCSTSQVFMNGVIHWVVRRRIDRHVHRYEKFILSFDVTEETFGEQMLPQEVKASHFEVSILSSENSLAVAQICYSVSDRKFFCIWVMKKYGVVESWSKVFSSDSRRYGGIECVLALRNSGQVVLNIRGGAIILLDDKMKVENDLGLRNFFYAFVGCHHVESLMLINKENDVFSY